MASGTEEPTDGPGDTAPAEERPLPPGPDGYPIIGSTLSVMRDPLGYLETLSGYGDVVRYRSGPWTFTALFHPEHVEQVLVEEHERFERWGFTDVGIEFAPEGLFSSGREQWRTQRRLVQPAFTMDRVASYADAMAGCAERTAREWDDGQEVVLNEAFSGLALEILLKTLFDVEPSGEGDEIAHAARVLNEISGPSRSLAALLPDWLLTPGRRRYERAMADYHERVDELIERRRDGAGDDLLSILLHAEGADGESLSAAEIRDNLITFTFAGHETTALGLTYAVLLLASHDDVADRLRAELDDVLGDERPGFEHVPRLSDTERVVTEAMRVYPPVPVMFRRARADADLGGYRIPEGTILTLSQFLLHRDGRFYDAPDQFRPGRWTDGMAEELPEYAYVPFGGGPRHCIGMRFATLEMKLVLAVLAREFEFELLSDSDPEFEPGATLRPTEDVRVRVHER